MSRVHTLVDTIIRLKRTSQADVSEKSGVHPSNLSKFLNGDSDIRSSSLVGIMNALNISLEEILEKEIEQLIGKKTSGKSLGDALETLVKEADPITAKTLLDSLSTRVKNKENKMVIGALMVINDFKSKIKTVRKHA